MKIIYCCVGAVAALSLVFLCLYVWAWHCNGQYGTKYDLKALIEMANMVRDSLIAVLANHSIFNTDIPWLNNILNKFKGGDK